MAVKRIAVHCVQIEDVPGSLQKLLSQAASAGVDFLGFAAFSAGQGIGKVYLSAKNSEALKACALETGIDVTEVAGFIVKGRDQVGAAAKVLKALGDAGINGTAGAAMVFDGQYQMLIVVEAEAGDAAEKVLWE